jgi:hypothetical protein
MFQEVEMLFRLASVTTLFALAWMRVFHQGKGWSGRIPPIAEISFALQGNG